MDMCGLESLKYYKYIVTVVPIELMQCISDLPVFETLFLDRIYPIRWYQIFLCRRRQRKAVNQRYLK